MSDSAPVNVNDFEALARARLSAMADEYLSAGAGDEITVRRNRESLDHLALLPRVLVDVSRVDMSLELLGNRLEHPILLAPCAYQKLFHPEGELEAARGAAAAHAIYVVSTFSTVSLESIAAVADAALWFQLYVQPDRQFTRDLMQRAESAGYRALCATVDTPMLGVRDRERRAGFHLPPGLARENLRALGAQVFQAGHSHSGTSYRLLDAALTWETIDWMRGVTRLPLVLKGILSPADALLAHEHGATAIIVSNHGGRNLDSAVAAIEVLPRIADAIQGRMPILMDGGIRRGTDVLKALACGAQAVLIGRPYLWGLAAWGAKGVEEVVRMLRAELEAAMMLCGAPALTRVTRELLWPPARS